MSKLDLIIRGGTVVRPEATQVVDLGVCEGKIVAIGYDLPGATHREIDASGLHVFPGLIDAHVHFNEPGRSHWEGIESGSRALAAGGGTMFFDMPLNSHPPTCDAKSFALKLAAAQKSSVADFALWGGLVPQNLDRMEELAACGVIGFKAFMSDSGIEDFDRVNEKTLRAGMKRAADLGLPVAVHAENEALTKQLAAEKIAAGRVSVRDYLESRPVAAELEAIRRAIELAGETKCALHVVHVSSGEGIALIATAKKSGVDVTCETCPHYLALTETDVEALGAVAKCAPPLRTKAIQNELWRRLFAGEINTIGSDHSPAPAEMKTDPNFFKVWGGVSGVQHTFPVLFQGAGKPGFSLSQMAKLTSFNVAERFHLPKTKGRIELGADADVALIDMAQGFTVRADDLLYRHRHSPYVGRALTGRVVQTILRGMVIFKNGKIVGPNHGQWIRPL